MRLIALVAVLFALPASRTEDPLPVLLVTGSHHHDWVNTTPVLVKLLDGTGRFKVTVTQTPEKDLTAETLSKVRLVFLHYRENPKESEFPVLNDKGENFIILDMGANELMDAAAVDAAESRIAKSSVVMAVLEVPVAAASRAMALGRKHGARTILNPAPARALPSEIFANVDYLTPNESELRILLGLPAHDPSSSRELAAELRKRGVRTVVVTLGRAGALILADDLDVMIPAVAVDVVDTTGAGDAFNSGFAVALAEGRSVVDAVKYGVVCGAIACTKLGVVPSLPDRARADAVYAEAQNSIWRKTK